MNNAQKTVREIVDSKSKNEWEYLIDQWIHDERARAMLKRHLLDGVSIQEVSEAFHLSWVQTQHILQTNRVKLFKHI